MEYVADEPIRSKEKYGLRPTLPACPSCGDSDERNKILERENKKGIKSSSRRVQVLVRYTNILVERAEQR